MESLLEKAINNMKASQNDFPQLISFTREIEEFDPISFFEAAKHQNKDRIFWSDPSFSIVGVGRAYEITAHGSHFEETEKRWQHILEKAIVHNPYKAAGTGIVAFGGMAFDPKKTTTSLWHQFNPSQFIIPECLVTKNEKGHFLTVTIQLEQSHPIERLENVLNEVEDLIVTQSEELPIGAVILNKEEIAPEAWIETIKEAKRTIKNKDAQKIVLARELRLQLNKQAEIAPILDTLLKTQPTSYIFAFERGDDCFVGATPERLVKIEGDQVLSTCLAGTAPRGKTDEEDKRIHEELLQDKKNLEEHRHVVNMITHSIEKYCYDVQVANNPIVYPLKNLQHLYTPVSGKLKKGYSIFDIVEDLHPTPALGGAPKESALQFIREHELLDRGWYGAPIGWLDGNGNGEFAVAIRSALVQGDEASLFAGCGIMEDSDPQTEYDETNIKFLPMLTVFGG